MDKSEHGKQWKGWVKNFFREREFSMEWDGVTKGRGRTNVGVPQGSPLSLVIFIIFMAPILEEMEAKLTAELQTNIEIPSYVDDILVCILDKEKKGDMRAKLDQANMIVNQTAAKWTRPLEKDKHETIVFNRGGTGNWKRKQIAEVERVKWLAIILGETLEFDYHWKSRIAKARKLLGALNGIGSSQWGIRPGSWRQLYTGMVRTVAVWGAELGWRGQKEWKREFERLQYQALQKCTGAVLGSNKQKFNKIAAVEDVETILNTGQAKYITRCMADPSTTDDIWEKEVPNKTGRPCNDHHTPWNPPKGSNFFFFF